MLSCFDAKTGATIYEGELAGNGGFKASPCVADGRIFCTDQRGVTFVVQAGPQFKLLSKNVNDEMTWSSPALADGAIFLRTAAHLLRIESPR